MVSDEGHAGQRRDATIGVLGVPSLVDIARAGRRALFLGAGADAQRRKARLEKQFAGCTCQTGGMADAIRTAIVRADSDIDFLRRLADDAKGE